MRKYYYIIMASLLTISCSSANQPPVESAVSQVAETGSSPVIGAHPENRPGDEYDELWGEKVPDPYRWLEDASNPDVQAWAKAQDLRARDYLRNLSSRESFRNALSELMYVPSVSVPVVEGDYAIYSERGARDEKSILYIRNLRDGGDPRVLIDPNTLSSDGSISLGAISLSDDGRLMTYKLKANNADQASVHIMDVETGKKLDDVIESGRYAYPQWIKDGSGFYYTHFPLDESIPVDERPGMTDIRFHKLGTPESEDRVVIGPLHDATKFHSVDVSSDSTWLNYQIQDGWNGNSVKVRKLAGEHEWSQTIEKKNTAYYPIIEGNALFVMTNDNAPKFRIIRIELEGDVPDLSESKWKEIIPESSDSVIQDFRVVQDRVFVVSIKDVVNYLDVYDLSGKHIKSIELPDKGSVESLYKSKKSGDLYFRFTSYKLPASIYRLNAESLELSMWAEIRTPAKTSDVISEQLFATSKDGTKIPYFVLRHKDTPIDGTARTIIYGYGGFNVSMSPYFSPGIYAWIQSGGIYVYSILRGGSEYGEEWHQAGMGMNKQNVFDDYYAVAEDLIAKKYTRTESLAAYGGSNGGLLTGAALTQRPDLYGAIVCAVPLLDMIRYQKFGSGRTWIGEYGNAENSEAEYRNIRAYSPYANAMKTSYPSVLFMGADSDDRVDPMHARKMTALIQDQTTSDNPVMLRIEKNSGHGGADLTSQKIEQMADMYSFLREVLK